MRFALFVVASLVTLVGCDDSTPTDGGVVADAGTDASNLPADIPWLDRGVPDVGLTPCPDGWREVVDVDGITVCDPYPEGGPAGCAFGEAHFVGEPGCRPIGAPCPAGEWPEELPEDESVVVFVRAGATGGDGSRTSPFGSLREVPWSVRGTGWTVALAKGRYEGSIPLRPGVQVVGACVEETIITGGDPTNPGVISLTDSGAMATVRNLSVLDASVQGVTVDVGSSLALEGVLIDGATQVGLYVDEGSFVSAADVVIVGTREAEGGLFGYGMTAERGARLVASRVVLADNRDIALFGNVDADLTISDAAIFETRSRAGSAENGRGINVQVGSMLVGERIWLRRNRDVSIFVSESSATLTDVVVADTLPVEVDRTDGRAIGVQVGGSLSLRRASISESREVAVFVSDEGSTAMLTDVVIRDTIEEESSGDFGRGISLQDGASLDAERVSISRSRDVGVFANRGSMLSLVDVAVRDTRERASDGYRGAGVRVQYGSTASATRLFVARSHQEGIAAIDATFSGRDVAIDDVQRPGCDCPENAYGYGVSSVASTMTLEAFAISNTATCGLFVSGEGSSLVVRDGLVSGSTIGACVQVDGYPLETLMEDTAYRDNETNLDATSLPVPEPIEGI